jgi:hypothetical protein
VYGEVWGQERATFHFLFVILMSVKGANGGQRGQIFVIIKMIIEIISA